MWLPAALFGVQPFPLTLSPAKKDFTAFTTLPARRLMLLKWKYPVPPTNTNWVKEVLYFLKLEQIRLALIGDAVSLERSWNLFLSDVNSWDVWSLCSLPTYIFVLLYWSSFIKLFLYFVYSFISLFTCLSIYSFSLFYQSKFFVCFSLPCNTCVHLLGLGAGGVVPVLWYDSICYYYCMENSINTSLKK